MCWGWCSGVDSFVQLAVDTTNGEQVAIKFVKLDRLDVHLVTREVVNQRACARHPHIVQLHVWRLPMPAPHCPILHPATCCDGTEVDKADEMFWLQPLQSHKHGSLTGTPAMPPDLPHGSN